MKAFASHTGTALPLRRTNVDTDQIVPARYLKRITRTGFEDALFADWRAEPDCILHDQRFTGASVLVAGSDFGTGSSREHAVWALQDYGFKVVISPRFADIFRGNAGNAGLLAAQVEGNIVERLWTVIETNPTVPVTIDLVARRLTAGDVVASFEVDDHTRDRLLEGLDDIGITLGHQDAISAYESARPRWRPAALARS